MSTTGNASKNVLNSDVEIKGNLKFAGELTFEGKLDGEIHTDGTLHWVTARSLMATSTPPTSLCAARSTQHHGQGEN
jgi:hypothetical protein